MKKKKSKTQALTELEALQRQFLGDRAPGLIFTSIGWMGPAPAAAAGTAGPGGAAGGAGQHQPLSPTALVAEVQALVEKLRIGGEAVRGCGCFLSHSHPHWLPKCRRW